MFSMKQLIDFKEEIHKCSKCGLCQSECPIYKITGNDCSVSRGQFIMLQGVIDGQLKMSKTINRYLDLCLKCGACSKFCPSGINIVDVILTAKSEYFKNSIIEKFKSFLQKNIFFGLLLQICQLFTKRTKSKQFNRKVLYFGGCQSKLKSNEAIIKILNQLEIEVIHPNFACCGIPYFSRGDFKQFKSSIKNYIKILKKYNIQEVVTTCASCEKSLKDYIKWCDDSDKPFLENIKVQNIYEYIKNNNTPLKLKKNLKITYHKPCNINNYETIEWLLKHTENLEYIEMTDFDKCCGLNGLSKIKEYDIMSKLFNAKIKNIEESGTKIVTTSCLGCEIALKAYSLGRYKVFDLVDIISKNI